LRSRRVFPPLRPIGHHRLSVKGKKINYLLLNDHLIYVRDHGVCGDLQSHVCGHRNASGGCDDETNGDDRRKDRDHQEGGSRSMGFVRIALNHNLK
jgi:hypothetical protein